MNIFHILFYYIKQTFGEKKKKKGIEFYNKTIVANGFDK